MLSNHSLLPSGISSSLSPLDKLSYNCFPLAPGYIRPCISTEYFRFRMEMQKHLSKQMQFSPQHQNGKQSRTVRDFGITKWSMLKCLLRQYCSNIKVHSRFGFRRSCTQKHQLLLQTTRKMVKIELIRFQFLNELNLLSDILGDSSLIGHRSKPPQLSNPIKKLKQGDKVNRLRSDFTSDDEEAYYQKPYEERGYDRLCEKNGVDLVYPSSGTTNLRIVTRHDMITVSDNYIFRELVGGGEVPDGNIVVERDSPRSVVELDANVDIDIEVGMVFLMRGDDDVHPYSSYDITWQVIESDSKCVKCHIIHPPAALNTLPKERDFTNVETVAQIIKFSN